MVVGDAIWMIVALSIDLNGQAKRVTVEIEDVGADRMLSSEAQACQASAAQLLPHQDFWQGEPPPKLSGVLDRVVRRDHSLNLS